jgi:hypothetical protein
MEHCMRRWLIRLTLLAVLLAALVAGSVQAVLWSDLPRRIVADQLAKQTGLVVKLDSLQTGWSGQTTVRGLSLKLPLANQPCAVIRRAQLHHTGLVGLVAGQGFAVEHVATDDLALTLRKLEDQTWNLARVAKVIQANQPPAAAPSTAPPPLPTVSASRLSLTLKRAEDTVTIDGGRVALTEPAGTTGSLAVDAAIKDFAQITGRVTRRAPWTQDLRLTLKPEAPWAKSLLGQGVTDLRGQARWLGAFEADGIAGRLNVESLTDVRTTLVGTTQISFAEGRLRLQPKDLTLRDPQLPDPVELVSGALRYHDGSVTLDRLTAKTLDGRVRLNGEMTPAPLTGEVAIEWAGLTYPNDVTHGGRFTLDVERGRPGQRSITGQMAVDGKSGPLGPWQGRLSLDLNGPAWNRLNGTVTLDRLVVERGKRPLTVRKIRADLAVEPGRVRLNQLSLPGNEGAARLTRSEGTYDLSRRAWSFELAGQQMDLGQGVPMIERLAVDLAGQFGGKATTGRPLVSLNQGELRLGGLALTATGSYAPDDPDRSKAIQGELALDQVPLKLREATRSLVQAQNLRGEIEVAGSIDPLRLTGEGQFTALNLQAGQQTLDTLQLGVEATADDQRLTVETKQLSVLGGRWAIHGTYQLDPAADQRYRVTVTGRQLELAELGQAIPGNTPLRGQSRLTLDARGDSLALNQLKVDGQLSGKNASVGPVRFDQFSGVLAIEGGQLRVKNLSANHGKGTLTGGLQLALDEPTQPRVRLKLEQWPVLATKPLSLVLGGSIEGRFNAAETTGEAKGQIDARLAGAEGQIAALTLPLKLRQSVLEIDSIAGTMLGGQASGQTSIDLQQVLDTRLNLQWSKGQPRRLATLVEPFAHTRGQLGGTVTIEPTTDPHALGPLRLNVSLQPDDAGYGSIGLGPSELTAYYVDGDPEKADDTDRRRLVLESLSSQLAGGEVTIWGRLSRHAGRWQLFASSKIEGLNLEPLTRTFMPQREPIAGIINVPEANLVTELKQDGPPDENLRQTLRHLHGRGSIEVNQSDFADIPLFALFYDLFNLNIGDDTPEGTGEAAFRLEEGQLVFERLQYKNRGVQVRLLGLVIGDVLKAGHSPIRGYALASLNPLPDIEAFEMINDAISTLQTEVTTLELYNTLANPKHRTIVLDDLGSSVGALLGEAPADQNPTPVATQPQPEDASTKPATSDSTDDR